MFDATKGQQAADTRLESLSDQLAADAVAFLGDPSIARARKEAALAAAANIFADPDQLGRLAQGTYAQNSAGQPAAQLGTGTTTATPTSSNAQEGLQAILDDNNVDSGIKQALKRLLTPRDPAHIPVGRDGTPSEIVTTKRELATARAERDQLEAERDTAREELANERNPRHHGSLAQQLAAVTAERDAARAERDAARAAAGGYDQDEARNKAAAVVTAINAQRGKRLSSEVEGKDEVRTKFGEFAQAVGLRRQP